MTKVSMNSRYVRMESGKTLSWMIISLASQIVVLCFQETMAMSFGFYFWRKHMLNYMEDIKPSQEVFLSRL